MFVNPFYFARRGLVRHIIALASNVYGKVLDVGCGQKPYKNLFSVVEYIGLELDTKENRQEKKADIFYDGRIFPFTDNEFDSVITNQVLEHVFNPDNFLREINRVLKPKGKLFITVPFIWDEHEQPLDYFRYSSFGIKLILEKNGFEILEQKKSVNDLRVIFQLLNGYIYKKIVTKNIYLNLLITMILIAPINLIGELLGRIFPINNALYLDNIILAIKV